QDFRGWTVLDIPFVIPLGIAVPLPFRSLSIPECWSIQTGMVFLTVLRILIWMGTMTLPPILRIPMGMAFRIIWISIVTMTVFRTMWRPRQPWIISPQVWSMPTTMAWTMPMRPMATWA